MNNPLLKSILGIDPTDRGHHSTLLKFKRLPELTQNALTQDKISYNLEVHKYQIDKKLASPSDTDGKIMRLDEWWAKVFADGSYPALSKMVKAILSCFHGPQVESAFSSMSSVLDKECGHMSIDTLSAIQTEKYKFLSCNKSALEFFKRDDHLHSPVHKTLCKNLRHAHKVYKEELG